MRRLGGETVVEIKTRGPEAFRRWKTLGAERSHPEAVAQMAFYTYGKFGGARDTVIATMDTGARRWDYEVVPADRIERAFKDACERLAELGRHLALNGPDPDALPDRDFPSGDWRCRRCPWLTACLPGESAEDSEDAADADPTPVTEADARKAIASYDDARNAMKDPGASRRSALDTLKAWMRGAAIRGDARREEGEPRGDEKVLGRPPKAQRDAGSGGQAPDRYGVRLRARARDVVGNRATLRTRGARTKPPLKGTAPQRKQLARR